MSVQLLEGGVSIHSTVLEPIGSPVLYVVPSVGVSVTALDGRRRTKMLCKSASPGFVQLKLTCESPAVPLALVTFAGEALSIVTVAESVSVPA